MPTKTATAAPIDVDSAVALRPASPVPRGDNAALREAPPRIRVGGDHLSLLADVQSADIPTEKLVVLTMTAWKQHTESAAMLTASIKALRGRLAAEEYRALLGQMPGFAI
jgi:hypothetical protein